MAMAMGFQPKSGNSAALVSATPVASSAAKIETVFQTLLTSVVKPKKPTSFSSGLPTYLDVDFYLELTARQRLDILKFLVGPSNNAADFKGLLAKNSEIAKNFLKLSLENNIAFCEELKAVCRVGGAVEQLLTACIQELRLANASAAISSAANEKDAKCSVATVMTVPSSAAMAATAAAPADSSAKDVKTAQPQTKTAGHLALEKAMGFTNVDVSFYNGLKKYIPTIDSFFEQKENERFVILNELTSDKPFMDFLMASVKYQRRFLFKSVDSLNAKLQTMDVRFKGILKQEKLSSMINDESVFRDMNVAYGEGNKVVMQFILILAHEERYFQENLQRILGNDVPKDFASGLKKNHLQRFF